MKLVQRSLFILVTADFVFGYSDDCAGGQRSPVDYGDLTQPGSGRALKVNGNDFEIFGEKVFLSGVTEMAGHHMVFGNDHYKSVEQEWHECFLWNLSQSGGNSIIIGLHGGTSKSPIFNATGHVVSLDSSGSFIKDVRKYLRAAAHYNIAVFFNIWWGNVFKKRHQLVNEGPGFQSYIDNALLPLVKAIKDEPGLGGFSVVNSVDGSVIAENNTEPCFDTHLLKENAHRFLSMKAYLRFVGKHVEAIRSVDPTIPVTTKTDNWIDTDDSTHYFNHFANDCLQKADGSSSAHLSFYTHDKVSVSRIPDLFMIDRNLQNLDKPIVLSQLSPTSSLPDMYRFAYSHGYSGAWAKISSDATLADSFSGVRSLRTETNISLGGLVNFTLTKYEICRHDTAKCVEKN